MKINCLACGHSFELDEAYSDYEGPVKCSTCSALLEIKLAESRVKSVKFLKLTRSTPEYLPPECSSRTAA